jgi:hypothetical protein
MQYPFHLAAGGLSLLLRHALRPRHQGWRDVISTWADVPTAIFTSVYGGSLSGQQGIHSVIPNRELHVYPAEGQGDHFLAFGNPFKFTADLTAFLNKLLGDTP